MALSATIAAVGTAGSIYSANKQAKAQKRASQQAARQAEAAQRQAQREFNAANHKSLSLIHI